MSSLLELELVDCDGRPVGILDSGLVTVVVVTRHLR